MTLRAASLIIFLTILVNLIGFGIIIPLLPFYAQTFGASPLTIGLLFASFSVAQLFASPVLGHWSDKWGRRPVLIFSLLGTVVSFVMLALAHSLAMLFAARIVDGLSGGNITTARAYIGDIATEREPRQVVRHARRGVRARLHHRPGPRAACSRTSAIPRRSGPPPRSPSSRRCSRGSGCPRPCTASTPTRARRGARCASSAAAPTCACSSPSTSSTGRSFAVYQTTFALFGARRFGFDATHTGYLLAAFGFLGVIVQGATGRPDRQAARREADADASA